jgi:hypothetical protein
LDSSTDVTVATAAAHAPATPEIGFRPQPGQPVSDHFVHYATDAAEPRPEVFELARRYREALGERTWEMLRVAADAFPGVFFSVEMLADALGTDRGDVRKRMRALGRSRVIKDSVHSLVENPTDAQPWFTHWDGKRNVYCFFDPIWPTAIVAADRAVEGGDE